MMHGELGQPPGGWPKALQKKVLKGETPITVRPGSLLPAADLEAERKAAAGEDRHRDRRPRARLLSHVPEGLHRLRQGRGDLRPDRACCRRRSISTASPVGEEILVELEKGKTLVIRTQAIGETDEDGQVRVFFELNGQPRIAKVPDRAHGHGRRRGRKAEEGNPSHVAAPMPGVVSTRRRQGRPDGHAPATCSSRSRR